MRTIGASLLAHHQGGETTLAYGMKVTRADAAVYGWTSHDEDATISSVLYRSGPGLAVSELAANAGFAVDNAELTILPDDTIVTRDDILAGRWSGAAFEIFRYNWSDLTQGRDVLFVGTFGEVKLRGTSATVELRGLQQALQQPIGSPSTKNCRARLGDAMCGIDLEDAAWKKTGTLTGVTSNQVFTDSARAEAADFFTDGTLEWTGGNNDGLTVRIKTHATGGVFTLMVPMMLDVQVGDTYIARAGCRKRLSEDCITKFDNVLNFQGEPHRPTVDDITKPAV